MNGNYKKILELCKAIIARDYAPCGWEDGSKKRLLGLTSECAPQRRIFPNMVTSYSENLNISMAKFNLAMKSGLN